MELPTTSPLSRLLYYSQSLAAGFTAIVSVTLVEKYLEFPIRCLSESKESQMIQAAVRKSLLFNKKIKN